MAMLLIGSLAPTASASVFGGIFGSIFSVNTAVSIGLGLVQRALMPDQVSKQQGARLSESQITTSVEGNPINRVIGRMRIGGEVIWATLFHETIVHTTTKQGGKGGPKIVSETTEYLYDTSFAVGLCEGSNGTTLGRVWADGDILDLSNYTYRFYDGTQTTPDSKIEAVEGVGTVPAFKGLCYIVFEDFPLADFGNRIPQITCEINRVVAAADPKAMENSVTAVNIIPGSGEYAYAVTPQFLDDGEGNSSPENIHGSTGDTDFVASLDRLGQMLPNVNFTSLVVNWYGDTIDGNTCLVKPKVMASVRNVTPDAWRVSDRTRATADVITTVDDIPAFGGTPSDKSVREAIIEMKARGLKVMLNPMLQMDMTDYPWRGRIEDGATAFLGSAAVGNFGTWDGTSLPYSGASEWRYRRMVLHYAALVRDILTSGDAFIAGSEMVGLTISDSAWGTGLATLIADVKSIVPAGVRVSYASDWSEYDEPNLLPVWAAGDFIGIDYYMPLTDWRTTDDEDYTLETFKAGIDGGEYWDYYYLNETDRNNGTQTPITAPEYRQKDIVSWRVAQGLTGKNIWFTEFGCPAIDKGANQPNVFTDAKSSESETPWFSTGTRNDTVQRLYIEAMIDYWSGIAENMFVWTWDARPYPAFPSLATVWADSVNWETGHWITGRLGTASVAETIVTICERVGYDTAKINTDGLNGMTVRVRGMIETSIASPSSALESLMTIYLIDCYEDGDTLYFVSRAASPPVTITLDDLVMSDKNATYSRSRVKDTDLPDRTKVDYLDELRDYIQASVDGHTVTGGSARVASISTPFVLDTDYARGLADVLTQEVWIARDTISFDLPFAAEDSGNVYFDVVKPWKHFEFQGFRYQIQKLTIGDKIEIEARGFSPSIYSLVDHATSAPTVDTATSFGASLVQFAELPLYSTDDLNPWSPRIAARQNPWPGQVFIYQDDGSGGHILNTTVPLPAVMGETTTDLDAGVPWVWDNANTVTVRLYDAAESLSSLAEATVLAGANTLAVVTPSGEWEVFQFVNATLNMDGTFTLSKLLRGQLGTEPYIGSPTPAGSRVIVYDRARLSALTGTTTNLGLDMDLRYGPSGVLIGDARFKDVTVTPRGVAYRPYAPSGLTQTLDGSDLVLSWFHRTRFDGDSWEVAEVPLNEEFERYEIDILDGATVVRTLVVDSATNVTYTSAQQTTDFGSPQASVSWVVYQMSATFGRGSPGYDS